MLSQEIITYLLGLSAIVSIILAVWNAIKEPQKKSELSDAIFSEKFKSLEGIVVNLRDNHIHTLSKDLNDHIKAQTESERQVCEKLVRIEVHLENILKKENYGKN